MTIHEELQGPLRCDQTKTQKYHESDLKKQNKMKPGKKIAPLESPANRCEQSTSEPSHGIENGMNEVHTCTRTRTHTDSHFWIVAIISTLPLESCILSVLHIAVLLTNLLAFMNIFGLPGRIISQLLLPLMLYFCAMLKSRQRWDD